MCVQGQQVRGTPKEKPWAGARSHEKREAWEEQGPPGSSRRGRGQSGGAPAGRGGR